MDRKKIVGLSNNRYGVLIPILAIFILFISILLSGCLGNKRISEEDAVPIALNDSRTLIMINNSDFEVYDVSKAVFDGQEMYQVSIKIVNGTYKRVNVFVTYNGDVISVGSQFPAPTPPGYPENKT
ncbi:MAG: hypothetical protein U9N09_01635 [Euryarchaeota archaeon]|nr:hypothetical protein [Euryarchaeota archaeon]